LDPIERAIRNALEKGDALDAAFRERVYVSAEHALSRSLSAHAAIAPADKHRRIEKLRNIAAQIEREFAPATEDAGLGTGQAQGAPNWNIQPESIQARPSDLARAPAKSWRKSSRSAARDLGGVSAKSNRRLSRIFIFVTVFALAVMLGWLLWTSGILDKPTEGSENPTVELTSESSSDETAPKIGSATDADEGWISVFAPSDAASLDLADGLSAELLGTGGNSFVVLKSADGQEGKGVASIEVGRGLLESLRGKKVIFDIQARAADAEGAQMSIACDLAGMGQCQRTRFRLESQLIDSLVSVQLNDIAPEASGVLSISPDLEGKGRPIEIHSVRVRVDQ
jgi:hypothetical protein